MKRETLRDYSGTQHNSVSHGGQAGRELALGSVWSNQDEGDVSELRTKIYFDQKAKSLIIVGLC